MNTQEMNIQQNRIITEGIRMHIDENGQEVARAFLYFMQNNLHEEPFGLMEDVFVEESSRGQGYGSMLVKALVEEAAKRGCYKLICTSRDSKPEVHRLYEGLGFKRHGLEFRIDYM